MVSDAVEIVRDALKSQFHAGLDMLRDAIDRCSDDLWITDEYPTPFWRVAYHTIFYTHLYMHPSAEVFEPWPHHQTSIQDLDDVPAPPEIMDLLELPHRPPRTGEPYSKAQILAYLDTCDGLVDDVLDTVDLESDESGFSWYRVSKVEHEMVAIRHLQHHVAQLGQRIRIEQDSMIKWVGARHR